MIWRSSLVNWHVQTAYTQAELCDWPAWQEGFSSACTGGEWFYRLLERRAIKLPSTLWTSVAAHGWGSAPVFYALPWALHVGSATLVGAIAQRMTERAGVAVLAGLLFGLHPAAAEVMVTGQFTQYVFGGFFSLLALWMALRRGPGVAFAGVLGVACVCDVTFLATPLVVLLWVDDRRRWLPVCAGVLGVAIAVHGVHDWLHPTQRHHHALLGAASPDERLLRALVVEPVLALRRLLLLWSPDSGPWSMDARVGEFEGLGPLAPGELLGLFGGLGAAAWMARRDLRAVARLGVLPIGLLLVDVCIKAGWSDVLASRWSGLRQVYVPAAFLALSIAWCLRGVGRGRVAEPVTSRVANPVTSRVANPMVGIVGAVVLLWAGSSSWRLTERTWARMADDERALDAAVARLRPLALSAGSTVYLLGVGDARPFSMWQGALRDRVGAVRFVVVTHGSADGAGTGFSRLGARELAVELAAEDADFLRPERQPSWAGPVEPSDGFALYLRRGGQLNAWPIFDRGVLHGRAVALPGIEGAEVRVISIADGEGARLVLRTQEGLGDPRTVLLLERGDGWVKLVLSR